tara:strand:+ start:219 stop:704 length:486 start_codon:yes stop_codon:yes gene_type:complete
MRIFAKFIFLFFFINSPLVASETKYLIINKSNRELIAFLNTGKVKKFSVSLGFEPNGTKIKSGDGKTPEGLYYIEKKIQNSSFYLALQISYPNPWDIRRAITLNKHPGGQIMIHGVPNSGFDEEYHNKQNDWTEGCIAITNKEMDFLWKKVQVGTPVLIRN